MQTNGWITQISIRPASTLLESNLPICRDFNSAVLTRKSSLDIEQEGKNVDRFVRKWISAKGGNAHATCGASASPAYYDLKWSGKLANVDQVVTGRVIGNW
jgi:hypothetical protein